LEKNTRYGDPQYVIFYIILFIPLRYIYPPQGQLPVLRSHTLLQGRDSSVDIAMAYGLEDRVRFPTGVRDFSLLHSAQTGSEVHPDSYRLGIGDFSLWIIMPGREADHSSPSSIGVKMVELDLHFPVCLDVGVLN
jgi:hypothetical protein